MLRSNGLTLIPGIFLAFACIGLTAWGSGSGFAPAQAGEVVCPQATGPVTIDGKPDEPAWAEAAQVGPLLTLGARRKPHQDLTYAKLLHDQDALYLAIRCSAPPGEKPKRRTRDNGTVWRADHVEIFFSPLPDSEDYYHLVVDRGGNFLDAWHTKKEVEPKGMAWNGDWRAATAQSRKGWTAEVMLPFAAFGVKQVKPGDLWRLKIGRDGGQSGPSMWPANPTSGFHSRMADAALYFHTRNLLINGDFETGKVVRGAPAPWQVHLTSSYVKNKPQGTVETVPGGLRPGKRALRFTKLPTALYWPQVWNWDYKLEPGGVYEFSIMAKGSMAEVRLRATHRLKGRVAKMSHAVTPGKEFSRLRFRFVVPEQTETVGVGLAAAAGVAGEMMFDNAVLRRMLRADDAEAMARAFAPADWSPDPDPVHGLDSLCERAGHKPWDLLWRKDHLLTYRVMFKDRKYGTWLWMLDKSPSVQYVVTASVWPGWNADCSVMMINGKRWSPDGNFKAWFCNPDFSRMRPQLAGGMPLWDLEDPDVYYWHTPGKVEKVDFRTGEQRVLATWEPRGQPWFERSYGLTKDNRSVFVADHDGGMWVRYDPAGKPVPYSAVLDSHGLAPDRKGSIRTSWLMAMAGDGGLLFRIRIGTRVYTDSGRTERVIVPIAGNTEYLKTFISGRVKFPTDLDANVPLTKDLEELFRIYHLYPSCSHGHMSYSPDGEYICRDSSPSHWRARDLGDKQDVRISANGWCYHTCWFYDPRFYVTCVRGYRQAYDRPINANILSQVFTDGTWQPVCDIKMRYNAYYYGGNFATLSRDATKVHYESSMTGVPKNYIAVMARPQPPRNVTWRSEADAVVLTWTAPAHHTETAGYLVYRGTRSGNGYALLTPEPVRAMTYRDATVTPQRPYYYVVTSLEHCGLESGYSAEAVRAGVRLPPAISDPVVVYVEAEDALAYLKSGDRPGLSRGRDQLSASNWYYVYRSPKATRGQAVLQADAPVAADYFTWVRVRQAGKERGQWAVALDRQAIGNVACVGQGWQWVKANSEAIKLQAGPHTLTLSTSDAGAQVDLICLATDSTFVPKAGRPEDRSAPAPVRGLSAIRVRDRSIQLTWQASSEPDFWHYNVYAAREPITRPDHKHLLASPTYPEFIDWGLRAGTTYHYAVTAVDRRGNEGPLDKVVEGATPPRPYPSRELELRFDQAKLYGSFNRAKAPGTRGKEYVVIPEKAKPEDAAAAKAEWQLELKHGGKHYVWLRYLPKGAGSSRGAAVQQSLKVLLNGRPIMTVGGGLTDLSVPDEAIRPEFWTWARPVGVDLVAVELAAGSHTLTVMNLAKAVRYDVLFITDEPSYLPTDGRLRQR